jgi:hypothetical protein
MSIRISEETIVLVAVVIGVFLLALVFLACSLNGRELLDASVFRCCPCRRRQRTRDAEENHVYETLNEFIFEAVDDTPERSRVATFNNSAPTTMEQVFPDLLGSDEATWRREEGNLSRGNNNNGNNNADLMEPLL